MTTKALENDGAPESAAPTLAETVLQMVEADNELPDDVELLIFAALEGDQLLTEVLGGSSISMDDVRSRVRDAEPPPVGAFLSSIAVQGFRGIGPELKLMFAPGPGLTVISGRNGSGKSSIAEGLEFALTGTSARSTKHTGPLWTGSWRNLHSATATQAKLTLAEEGSGNTDVAVEWPADTTIDAPNTWVQRKGKRRQAGRSSLGWTTGLELYRPLLSYDELGGLLEGKPSDLFDKLEILLGLEPVTLARNRLTAAQKNLKVSADRAKAQLLAVRATLASSGDENAQRALALLKPRTVDLDKVAQLITGAGTDHSSELMGLRSLASYAVPDPQRMLAVAAQLTDAAAAFDTVTAAHQNDQSAVLDLLARAVAVHRQHGDMPCPVCGVGELDADWAARAAGAVGSARESAAEISAARDQLQTAQRTAAVLVSEVPPIRIDDQAGLAAAGEAVRLVAAFRSAPTDPKALAEHLTSTAQPLADTIEALKTEAAQLVSEREDRWAPIATQLAGWLTAERESRAVAGSAAALKRALDWLRDCTDELLHQRLAPISEQARLIWSRLRQESNVELGAISLVGQNTSRKVVLEAQVDGQAAGALGVMSQGELHALSLALFIPRATMPDSPFRFIILDDPIQAMDPSKVDGFVSVLGDLARTRQVVVLSHDDRLAAAVRRSTVDARLMELNRGADSVVTVRSASDPAERHLADAFAIAKDKGVTPEVVQSVIPALCRLGLESAALDVFRARRLKAGAKHGDLEAEWRTAKTLGTRLALAIHGDTTVKIDGWLDQVPKRRGAFTLCNTGVHTGVALLDFADSVNSVRKAVQDLRAMKL